MEILSIDLDTLQQKLMHMILPINKLVLQHQ